MKRSIVPPKISAIVCTYNRGGLLSRALQSLVEQSLNRRLYEVVIVDNGSTDNTLDIVTAFQSAHHETQISFVSAPKQGLGYARNIGFENSRGTYLAFMDDDAWADKDWLELTLECFERVKPKPRVVGGPIYPHYDSRKPSWFKDDYEIRTWGDHPRFLKRGESFSGSNMILEREIIADCGGFDVKVGMRGHYLSVGEETNLFNRIWQDESDERVLYYSPHLMMFHAVSEQKMTVMYQLKRAFATGQAWQRQNGSMSSREWLESISGIGISIACASSLALTDRREYPTYQNWIVEGFAPIAMQMGRLIGYLGIFIPVKQRQS